MIRCRKCGITYHDNATLCLRCMNPLPKPTGKNVVRKPVRQEVLDKLIAERNPKNILIATATPRPRKLSIGSLGDSTVTKETSNVSAMNTTVSQKPDVHIVSKLSTPSPVTVEQKTPDELSSKLVIQEAIPTPEPVLETSTPKEELSTSAKATVIPAPEKIPYKQELSKLMDAIKELDPDKTVEGIDPRLGDIRVDEIERLSSIVTNLENAEEIYARSKDRILFDRGYVLQSGYITHLNIFNLELTTLPDNLVSLQKLTSLDLERNNFDAIPDGLDKLPSLVSLNVSENKLTELSSAVRKLTQLKSIWLYDNSIAKIPSELSLLTNLELLDLRGNKLTSKDLDPIWQLTKLKYLSLESNNLNSLPENLDTLTDLEVLLVGHNPLEVFPDISNLRKLKELSLYGTKLKYAPESMLFLPNLQTLDLWNTAINPDDWILMELRDAGVIIKMDNI